MGSGHHPFRFSASGLRGLELSATLAINERVNQMWAQGLEVYHLGFGESRFPVHPKIAEALRSNAYQHSYLPSQGLKELRERIAEFYEARFKIPAVPERVMIGPGSKALIYALLQALDGELLLPTPSWVSYRPQAQLVGKGVIWIPSSPAEGHALTLQALRETVNRARDAWRDPKILLLNSPNNPTGRMFDQPLVEQIAEYCREEGLVVLSDEIYGLIGHGHKRHLSIARHYPEGTVVLGGLSKHLSLGGWRLGVAIFPPTRGGAQVMRAVRTIASETWSATTGPVQYAALVAYSNDPDVWAYIEECTRLHAIRTQYLWRALVDMGIRCARPDGAFYLFPNFDHWREPLAARGITTSAQLAVYLLEKFQLATLPGSVFGTSPDELSLRLSSTYLDMETEEKAWKVLKAYRAVSDPEVLMREHHPAMNEAIARFRLFVQSLMGDGVPVAVQERQEVQAERGW